MFSYGSVCSGIEAVSVAWQDFATPLWFSEIEAFPCALLQYHYPNIPNLGDMQNLPKKILHREIPAPDVLIGGTPCQSYSYAGKRHSLNDERGGLMLTFINIANAIDKVRKEDGKDPVIIIWENVPGVLTTKDNAFGCFLGGLAGANQPLQSPGKRWTDSGYVCGRRDVAWRVFNAQHFGLAQRRRRIFVIAGIGEQCSSKILFEPKSLRRYPAPGRNERESITAYIESRFSTFSQSNIAGTLRAKGGTVNNGAETIILDRQGNIGTTITQPLTADDSKTPHIICVHGTQDPITSHKTAHCLGRNNGQENVITFQAGTRLRRLTPTECERLMGFPDNYTQIPYRNKPALHCPDTPRYKALGNSMAVPIVRWIGQQLIRQLISHD